MDRDIVRRRFPGLTRSRAVSGLRWSVLASAWICPAPWDQATTRQRASFCPAAEARASGIAFRRARSLACRRQSSTQAEAQCPGIDGRNGRQDVEARHALRSQEGRVALRARGARLRQALPTREIEGCGSRRGSIEIVADGEVLTMSPQVDHAPRSPASWSTCSSPLAWPSRRSLAS